MAVARCQAGRSFLLKLIFRISQELGSILQRNPGCLKQKREEKTLVEAVIVKFRILNKKSRSVHWCTHMTGFSVATDRSRLSHAPFVRLREVFLCRGSRSISLGNCSALQQFFLFTTLLLASALTLKEKHFEKRARLAETSWAMIIPGAWVVNSAENEPSGVSHER